MSQVIEAMIELTFTVCACPFGPAVPQDRVWLIAFFIIIVCTDYAQMLRFKLSYDGQRQK